MGGIAVASCNAGAAPRVPTAMLAIALAVATCNGNDSDDIHSVTHSDHAANAMVHA